MKTILHWRRHIYLARLGTLLITVALIAGMVVGCEGGGGGVEYDLTIDSTAGGSVTDPGEDTFTCDEGEVVNLVAVADDCYEFVNWTGDAVANPNSPTTTITMDAAKEVTANFAILSYDLSVNSTDGGSVTTPGESIFARDCGTAVDLVATPDPDYSFVEWTGDIGTVGNVIAANTTITMNGDCTITANFFQGHLIRDWYDLNAVRDNLDDNYLLMNDLDSDTAGYEELASETANGGAGWDPIDSFTGTFDGQGYEINNLFINRPTSNYIGLFGSVGSGGLVENVGVNGNITGRDHTGCLAGQIDYGTVSNSYSIGSATGRNEVGLLVGWSDHGTVSNSYSTGSATGISGIGGLVGRNLYGTVSNSYSTGSATGINTVGGLIGFFNFGTVSNSYSTGSVTGDMAGGLIGYALAGGASTVSNSYSTGNVTGATNVGGLVGYLTAVTVSNSFWDKDTSGQIGSAGGIGKTTAEMQDFDTFDGAGWDIVTVADSDTRDTNYIWNTVDDVTYPFLSWQPV